MPPNQTRSTGAFRIAEMSAVGSISSSVMPSAAFTSGVRRIVLALRGKTPPPAEISALS